ncbi:MAG TPA: hypothetical protein VKZ63_13765, partial [Kofleriaceae bacterium]|nr:hypothetical protein [Kofleriaceae bacterium]
GERGVTAVLSPLKPRIEWRAVERRLEARGGDRAAAVQIRFPAQLPAAASEDQVVDAALKGLSTAVRRLELAEVAPLSIYVYPDRRSKQSLTGDAGDGHAVPAARAVHVIATGDTAAADLEGLIAHEGTHVLAHAGWGPAGSPLLGEGLAVWVSGRYGGAPLSAWRGKIGAPPPLASLLGPGFRRLPEQEAYPVAGLLVDAAIARAGIAAVRDHLLAATPETWDAACKRAGLSSAELEADLARGASR